MNKKQITGIVMFFIGVLMMAVRMDAINVPEPSKANIIYSQIACGITLVGMLLAYCGKPRKSKCVGCTDCKCGTKEVCSKGCSC